jgi:endo-1,4-beta-D-glucanase Y
MPHTHPLFTALGVGAAALGVSATALGLMGSSSCGKSSPPTSPASSPTASTTASRPFAQNAGYGFGFRPGNVSAADAETQYQLFKQRYVKADCGAGLLRVEFTEPLGSTVSEGMGYGMLLAAYHGDKSDFDQLFAFVKKNWDGNQLMGWKVTCAGPITGVGGQNAATDAELDIALSLVVAANQWGGAYRDEAKGYAGRMKANLWQHCAESRRFVQRPGDTFGGCDFGNTSYWMPGYYRVFKELTGDEFWDQAVAGAYAQIFANRHPQTGLLSNEADQFGAVAKGYPMVDYNGARTPWRIGTDYIWNGTAEAKDVADKMTNWAASRGISEIPDGFGMDGRPAPGHSWTRSNPFTGAWAAAAMTHSQARVDSFSAWFKGCNADDGYYGTALRTLYMFTLSGNFWRPSGR